MISLPNELIQNIVSLTEQPYLTPYLFVCKFTFQLVRQKAYKKVIFPDYQNIQESDIISFCRLYGLSIESMKLPRAQYFSNELYSTILTLCPRLDFLQSNIYPKQLKYCLSTAQETPLTTSFMMTDIPLNLITEQPNDPEEDPNLMINSPYYTVNHFSCCPSFFIFPTEFITGTSPTLTQISHYFHHPGALSNAILPTFGSDLLSLTLNPYDILTCSVAKLIVAKCPKLRYLVVPSIKAEGLWMLLRWCHTLSTIIVGFDPNSGFFNEQEEIRSQEDELVQAQSRQDFTEKENQRAVETVQHHKRVWCIHENHHTLNNTERLSWHIGIIPKT